MVDRPQKFLLLGHGRWPRCVSAQRRLRWRVASQIPGCSRFRSPRNRAQNLPVASQGREGVMTEQLKLAHKIANTIGLPPTWPKLRTIEIALIFQAAESETSLREAADTIIGCAWHFIRLR